MNQKKPDFPSKLRGTLLPTEHGSWGFIAEPILLGLLIAPTIAGSALAVFSFCAFLLRTPLLRTMRARRAAAPDPYGVWVRRFCLLCLLVSLGALVVAALTARGEWILPFILAVPLALWALHAQYRGKTRQLFPEVISAVALGAPATAMLLAAGTATISAYLAWGYLALKSITSILFVRSQIKRFHNRPHGRVSMLALHAAVPMGLAILDTDIAVIILYTMLALRAAILSYLPVRSAKQVGWIEVTVSLIFVIALAAIFP